MLHVVCFAAAAFVPPSSVPRTLDRAAVRAAGVRMQMPEMPKLPKINFKDFLGGIEVEAFGDQFAAPGDLKLLPSDVQFVDVDGDTITLRGVYGGKIDYYVGKTLKLSGAILAESGGSLQITGTTKKGTPLSFLGFNLQETITDSMTPKDPEDLAKAMALVA